MQKRLNLGKHTNLCTNPDCDYILRLDYLNNKNLEECPKCKNGKLISIGTKLRIPKKSKLKKFKLTNEIYLRIKQNQFKS